MNSNGNGNLTAADLAMFSRLGIPVELLSQAHIERVTDRDAREKYGIKGAGDMGGIVFPYINPAEGRRWTGRVRRDNPELEAGKLKNKYVSAYGDRRHLFFPPESAELLTDITVPLVLVEAEKSALALTAWAERTGRRILPVGMGGCWGWRGRIGKVENSNGERVDEVGALQDLLCASNGRKTYVLLEGNVRSNPKVQQARGALVGQLRKQGADVWVLDLPAGDGINGPDDYIGVHGDEAMAEVTASAEAGAATLSEIEGFVRRFVSLSDAQATVVPLWIVHTHSFGIWDGHTPYLSITSAEKQSGKTRLLEILELTVRRPWLTGRATAAALVRKIHREKPTLLLDEMDCALKTGDEYSAALTGVLNNGYRPGMPYTMCVGQGASITEKNFNVFCPKALAGIGQLPDTVADRSIPLRLKRQSKDHRAEKFHRRDVAPQASELRGKIAEWSEKAQSSWLVARPEFPHGLSDRREDVIEPLLAIADSAGGSWPARAREALVEIFGGVAAEDQSIRVKLLADIYVIFEELGAEKISSSELVAKLAEIETSQWAEWSHGKPMSPVQLARQLKNFHIFPRTIRVGDATPKGYERDSFSEAWRDYLPQNGASAPAGASIPVSEAQHSPQCSIHAGPTQFSKTQQEPSVADQKSESSPMFTRVVADVADQKAYKGQEQEEEHTKGVI